MNHKPIQYQQGYSEFYKLKFYLTANTLIPRPETELLVDEIIALSPATVLDLGTGSGNLAIAIAKNLPHIKITATDISPKALEVALKNAQFHQVASQIVFELRDLLQDIEKLPDVIVTNLPYIPTERIRYLDSSVKDYEPHIALDGGKDGFELYRKLFAQIAEKKFLPKYILGEIDYTQADFVLNESRKFFPQAQVVIKKDLTHTDRYFLITFQ
jgi:release factor glutamine methyltransferase